MILTGDDAATQTQNAALISERGVLFVMSSCEEFFVLCRPGSDLLSQGLSHSTIGAEEFNGRVRDGIGLKLLARTTRPAKDKDTKQTVGVFLDRLSDHLSCAYAQISLSNVWTLKMRAIKP